MSSHAYISKTTSDGELTERKKQIFFKDPLLRVLSTSKKTYISTRTFCRLQMREHRTLKCYVPAYDVSSDM